MSLNHAKTVTFRLAQAAKAHRARSGQHLARIGLHPGQEAVLKILADAYGDDRALLWHERWRMFWMACAELFGYRDGTEWLVGHYRFAKP